MVDHLVQHSVAKGRSCATDVGHVDHAVVLHGNSVEVHATADHVSCSEERHVDANWVVHAVEDRVNFVVHADFEDRVDEQHED